MISYLASIAVRISALWTIMSPHVFLLITREKVVTVLVGAIKIVFRAATISYHLPLKSLCSVQFILSQQHFKINFTRKWHLAVHIGAPYRKFALLYLRAHVLRQTLTVIYICTSANLMQFRFVIVKKRHEADLASFIGSWMIK